MNTNMILNENKPTSKVKLGEGTLKDGQTKPLVIRERIEFKKEENIENVKHANLRKIEFEKLSLKKLNESIFDNFSNLTVIIFRENSIKELNKHVFKNLARLKHIDFSRNSIEKLDAEIFRNCRQLEYIHFSDNSITELDESIFSGLINLLEIDFSNNEIDGINKNLFTELVTIRTIDFSANRITKLSAKIFENNKEIEKLDFSSNQLDKLDGKIFQNIGQNLLRLNFSDNRIEELDKSIFSSLTCLEWVDFSTNQITLLDDEIFKRCIKLEHVNFSNNHIKELNKYLFQDLNDLLTMDFSSNEIRCLDIGIFKNKLKLTHLSLSNNLIQELNAEIFKDLARIKEIDFSFNFLERLDLNLFDGKTDLKKINFSHNNIRVLSSGCFKCPNLLEFNFSCNQIEELNLDIFKYTRKLHVLDFSYNRLIKLDPRIFSGLDSLAKIDFKCAHTTLDRFLTWDHRKLFNEFFKVKIEGDNEDESENENDELDEKVSPAKNYTYSFRYDVYLHHFLMLEFSQDRTNLLYKFKSNRDIVQWERSSYDELNMKGSSIRYLLLDYMLALEKIPNKTVIRFLDVMQREYGMRKIIYKRDIWMKSIDSIVHLCKRDKGPNIDILMEKLEPFFPFENFYECFEIAIRSKREAVAIGLFKIFWAKVKSGLNQEEYTTLSLARYLKKYNFFINNFIQECFDFQWWRFFAEILNMYEREKGDLAVLFCMTIDCGYMKINKAEKKYTETNTFSLMYIALSDQKKLIGHPSTKKMLDLKWRKWPRAIYFNSFIIYVLFCVFYTINLENYRKSGSALQNGDWSWICSYILVSLLLGKEIGFFIIGTILHHKTYKISSGFTLRFIFKPQNFINIINFYLCFINLCISGEIAKTILFSLTIIFTYFTLIFHLELFDMKFFHIGIYVTVFKKVLIKSIGGIPLVLLSIVAFILAFRVASLKVLDDSSNVHEGYVYNGSFWLQAIRTMAITLGEYDSQNMGLGDDIDTNTLINYILYPVFLFVMPLIVINMFLGISVGEIEKLLDDAANQIVRLRVMFVIKHMLAIINELDRVFLGKYQVVNFKEIFFSNYEELLSSNRKSLSTRKKLLLHVMPYLVVTFLLNLFFLLFSLPMFIFFPIFVILCFHYILLDLYSFKRSNRVSNQRRKSQTNETELMKAINEDERKLYQLGFRKLENKLKDFEEDIERLSIQQKENFLRLKHDLKIQDKLPVELNPGEIYRQLEDKIDTKLDIFEKMNTKLKDEIVSEMKEFLSKK